MSGNASSIQKTAEEIMKIKKIIIDLLSEDTGQSKETIEKALSMEKWMSAQECIEFGICDKIVTTLI